MCTDGSVRIATAYVLDCRGIGVRSLEGTFSSPQRSDGLCGPLSPRGFRVLPPGINRQEHEGDNSPPSITVVKNTWTCTAIPPYVLMTQCYLIKHRTNLLVLPLRILVFKWFYNFDKTLSSDEIYAIVDVHVFCC